MIFNLKKIITSFFECPNNLSSTHVPLDVNESSVSELIKTDNYVFQCIVKKHQQHILKETHDSELKTIKISENLSYALINSNSLHIKNEIIGYVFFDKLYVNILKNNELNTIENKANMFNI